MLSALVGLILLAFQVAVYGLAIYGAVTLWRAQPWWLRKARASFAAPAAPADQVSK